MIHICTFLFLVLSSVIAQATDVIIGGLSEKNVSINTTFTGSDILIFGSIKRSDNQKIVPSDVIVEILGPNTNLTIRKKKKIFGIWINSDPTKLPNSPSFYSLLYTNEPKKILSSDELERASIGEIQFFKSNNGNEENAAAIKAKIRIKTKEGSYIFNNDLITIKDNTLFSARVSLPANLTEGDYKAKIHLIQNRQVINSANDIIEVRKIGLEKWLYNTAHDKPLFYGIFSIVLALFFGWGASTLFRRFQK